MASYSWDSNQREIFKVVLTEDSSIAIKATAGSGKTTVLAEISKLLPNDESSVFLAFNKTIVSELKERLSSGFDVSTLHSMGMRTLQKNFGRGVKLNPSKVYNAAKKMMFARSEVPLKEKNSRIYYAQKGYDYARSTMVDISSRDSVEDMLDRFRLSSDYGYEDLVDLHNILSKYNSSRKRGDTFEIDFSDMIYLPATMKLKTEKYQNVLVDEVQDLNKCQSTFIGKIRKRGSRLITVGDGFQNIYLFVGSDTESFESFQKADGTRTLPLSVTYRCPIAVVEEARKYCPTISHAPNAEQGFVGEGFIEDVEEGDAVLCRNNSPLFEAYIDFLDDDKKAYIVGKDIQEKFDNLMYPYRNSHISSLIDGLRDGLDRLDDLLKQKGVKKPENHPQYQALSDISRALSILASKSSNMSHLRSMIDDIFCPKKDAIILSSIHKSKGLEYDNVFLLRPDLLPNKFAKSEEELKQESNLMFVAITRAKKEFKYIYKKED